MMKKLEGLVVLGITALLIAACALPVGEDYTINRTDGVITYGTAYDLPSYVPIPQAGDKPVRNLPNRPDLAVKTEWLVEQPAGSSTFEPIPDDPDYTFALGTVYQAVITLQTNSGYQFAENIDFAYTPPEMVSALEKGDNSAEARIFTITYKATKQPAVVSDCDLTLYIPKPMASVWPLVTFGGEQYTGTVVWKKAVGDVVLHGPFQPEAAYKAEVTLSPRVGYTLTGLIGVDSFSHAEAETTVYDAGSGIITITFSPATYFINLVECFGPVGQEGSALALLKEHRDDFYPLVIELPPTLEEPITTGFTLAAGETSPTTVIIDGQGGTLKIENAGNYITVAAGVSLTLQNITIEGFGTNDSPLFKVLPGGRLILDEGVVLADNTSAGAVGGVWVNGGSLKLRDGAEIKGLEGEMAGGVLIDNNGSFFMEGGTIGGEAPGDANESTAGGSAGGVYVKAGTFEMQSGTIQKNTAAGGSSGGGVYIDGSGIFTMQGGSIQENTAGGDYSGGGVYICGYGTFTMQSEAIIQGNTANGDYCGAGVYIGSNTKPFIMSGDAQVDAGNPVYLTAGMYITLDGDLSAGTAANIIYNNEDSPSPGTKLLRANSEALITGNRTKFLYKGVPDHINETPRDEDPTYYGVYQSSPSP
jgi:hypothetical protein